MTLSFFAGRVPTKPPHQPGQTVSQPNDFGFSAAGCWEKLRVRIDSSDSIYHLSSSSYHQQKAGDGRKGSPPASPSQHRHRAQTRNSCLSKRLTATHRSRRRHLACLLRPRLVRPPHVSFKISYAAQSHLRFSHPTFRLLASRHLVLPRSLLQHLLRTNTQFTFT